MPDDAIDHTQPGWERENDGDDGDTRSGYQEVGAKAAVGKKNSRLLWGCNEMQSAATAVAVSSCKSRRQVARLPDDEEGAIDCSSVLMSRL